MMEISLIIVIFMLICVIGVLQYTGIMEREKLLKLLMAKDLTEVTTNEIIEKRPKSEKTSDPDVVEITPDDETIFDKMIKEQIRGTNNQSEEQSIESI